MRVTFWGVRGSIATGGSSFAGFGGNTTCVEVTHGEDRIILDAGTGVRALGHQLLTEGRTQGHGVDVTFLFSHLHWDHIQGFPFFAPGYVKSSKIRLMGPIADDGLDVRLEDVLLRQMQTPTFPVPLGSMRAEMSFGTLASKDRITVGSIEVEARALKHPQGSLGFRISAQGRSICFATDTEQDPSGGIDEDLAALARDVDLLIHDAQYTDAEYADRVGWGHSTHSVAADVARASGAKALVLFHHDPSHDDAFMHRMESDARSRFPWCVAAREGLSIEV